MQDADARMRKRKLFILIVLVLAGGAVSFAVESEVSQQKARAFAGQDLQLSGRDVTSYQSDSGEHILVFQGKFSMSVGANQFFSNKAVVWVKGAKTEYLGESRINYNVNAYLEGRVSVKKGKSAKTTDLSQTVVEDSGSMVVQFDVDGEVFVTVDKREVADPRELELYKKAEAAIVPKVPAWAEVKAPELPSEEKKPPKKGIAAAERERLPALEKRRRQGLLEMMFGGGEGKPAKPVKAIAEMEVKGPRFTYPVNIAPAGKVEPKIERTRAPDGTDVATVEGRFYVWQKQDEAGGLLELEADSAVMFYSGSALSGEEKTKDEEVLTEGGVQAIYMSGNVVMTEGQRTIRSDEMYYDFQDKRALAVNAEVRNFDVERGIPIYVRAAKLRRIAEDKFSAEGAVLTSSEFYLPQISITTSKVVISDTTAIDAQKGRVSRSSYDVEMRDVRFKAGKRTLFYWPGMRANFERPDIPIKKISAGRDNTFGTFVESRWYLSRLLGLREPEGTDSTLLLDYYSKRGFGSGVDINYDRENYYGKLLGYVISDHGEDRLGRISSRKDLEPDKGLRGRLTWRHRQFLPYNWQLTTGVSYLSDENFLESFYRREFNTGEKQETYVHLKRLQDNWALSILGKGRINNFADELEELPSAEFHLTGQSLFEDRFTLYSDSEIGRLRQRIGKDHSQPIVLGATPAIATNLTNISEDRFTFASHRTELDMPIQAGSFKVIPYVAGTFGYDNRSGFTRTLVDGSNTGSFGDKDVWIGEAGVRVFPRPYWKVYPDVKSRLWDLSQLRHIVRPYLTAVVYEESDDAVEQRDALSAGISQRLLTKRGREGAQRTVEWMRLDTEVTWLSNTGDAEEASPDRYIWARPIVPMRVLSAPEIFNGDLISHDGVRATGLHRFENWGPRRDYFSADYIWRMSDTSAVLSDLNFDIQSMAIQQFNIGFSHLCWPNLSYYIGSRYLRRVRVLDEEGSNAFVFAATYVLDPRYTIIFAQEYDFDYGLNVRSDVTLLRRYHRMYYGLTFSADESLDRQSVVFSIWPQGVPEMGTGGRKYTGMTGPAEY
ncbi:MAG: hypothetical protein PHQ35_08300 [Phycisphaerae bacterium]|nr:hypothetical protein [Phycisphaerae bacterium]MDD5381490.1 hypothetical protein [Phycisphaerae bacterium]